MRQQWTLNRKLIPLLLKTFPYALYDVQTKYLSLTVQKLAYNNVNHCCRPTMKQFKKT